MFTIKNIQISIVIFMILMFIISMLTVFSLSAQQITLFLLYQIILILIPGLAAVLLTKIKLPLVSLFCYSYICGYVINIFEYFIIKYTENFIPTFVTPLIILIISAFIIFKKKNDFTDFVKDSCNKEQLTTLVFLGLFLFFNIFVFALNYININKINHDFYWWCANSVSLKLGFPPEYLFMKGVGLYYHYFSNIQIAFFNLVSNIDIKTLSIPFYSITKTIVMIGAIDFVLNILKLNDAKFKAFILALVLLTTGFEKYAIITYFSHILLMPFGFDIGYALGFIYTALIVKQFYKENFDIKIFIQSAIFYFICTGAKSPISHVLLALTGLVCLYWLIKKNFANAFLYGITTIITGIFVNYYFIGAGKVLSETSNTFKLNGFYSLADYGNHPFLNIVGKILSANISISIIIILSIIAIISLLLKHIKVNNICLMVIMLITYIIGTLVWLTINVGGHSEMYYEMASFIPLVFFILLAYNTLIDNVHVFNKKFILSYKILFIGALIFGMVLNSFCAYGKNGMIRTLSRNLKKNLSYKEKISDLKPLLWIRDNSPKNSVILADNFAIKKDRSYYTYGILTERWQYLEEDHMLTMTDEDTKKEIEYRKNVIKNVFANDENTLKQLKNEGISYVISTHKITPDFSPNEKYLELVSSSKKFKVYKVK